MESTQSDSAIVIHNVSTIESLESLENGWFDGAHNADYYIGESLIVAA